MDEIFSLIFYIFGIGLFPLAYCIFFFYFSVKYLSKLNTFLIVIVQSFLGGVSFLFFQILQSISVIFAGYFLLLLSGVFEPFVLQDTLTQLYDLLFDTGALNSWIGVTNIIFPGSFVDNWEYQHLWQVEFIYILFYVALGFGIAIGVNLWRVSSPVRFLGLLILLLVFSVYTYGVYFWMATAMYL